MPNPATNTAPGDVTAPPIPSPPIVVPYGRGLQISVGAYTKPDDFLRYRYYRSDVGGIWRESDQPTQIDYDTAYNTPYTYQVSAIDTTLPPNESALSGATSGTPVKWQTPDYDNGTVTTPKLPANAITGGATHISDVDTTTTSPNYVNIGSEVQFTISSSISPILITFSGSVILRNLTGPTFNIGVTVAICKAVPGGGTGDNLPLQEMSGTFVVPAGGVIEIPFSLHYTDVGPVGLDGYRVRFKVDASGFSRAESLSRRTMQATELKR